MYVYFIVRTLIGPDGKPNHLYLENKPQTRWTAEWTKNCIFLNTDEASERTKAFQYMGPGVVTTHRFELSQY